MNQAASQAILDRVKGTGNSQTVMKALGNHSRVMDVAFERLNEDIQSWEKSKVNDEL